MSDFNKVRGEPGRGSKSDSKAALGDYFIVGRRQKCSHRAYVATLLKLDDAAVSFFSCPGCTTLRCFISRSYMNLLIANPKRVDAA
jgi:hypothetical protein